MKPIEEKKLRSALQSVYENFPGASDVLDLLAQGGKRVKATTVDSVVGRLRAKRIVVPRRQVIRVLKALAEAGCGEFVVGRHTKPSRIVWSVSAASAGQVAGGLDDDFEEFDAGWEDLEDEEDYLIKESDFDDEVISHTFRLRREMSVEFRLPKDLTATEAARLADFIQALPFSR